MMQAVNEHAPIDGRAPHRDTPLLRDPTEDRPRWVRRSYIREIAARCEPASISARLEVGLILERGRGFELFAKPRELVAERQIGAPGGAARGEGGGVAVVPLAQIGHDRRVDRYAREIVQQQPAMRRSVRADALEPDQIIVAKPLSLALAAGVNGAVVEHLTSGADYRCCAKAEPGTLTQPFFAVVEHRLRPWKGAVTRLGDERRCHSAGRGPAGVDGQHGLDEILVEGRAAQYTAAAALDQRPVAAENCNCLRRLPIGRQPAQ